MPPPFGGGYFSRATEAHAAAVASIVPPPFGGGYLLPARLERHRRVCFNCAAPFRGRLLEETNGTATKIQASIVPPPFGGGYQSAPTEGPSIRPTLQLCRPLSGAVTVDPK